MPSKNKTQNLNLSQFTAGEKPSWLTDYNGDMLKLEEAMQTAKDIANGTYAGVDLSVKFAGEIAATPGKDVWTWIKSRIQAGNFAGLNIGDYIPFVAGGNNIKAAIAGINTYAKDYMGKHHIDFISRDCWPVSHAVNKIDWNNGTTQSPSPWLASDIKRWLNSESGSVPISVTRTSTSSTVALTAVNYTTTGVYDKLPAALKAVIVAKNHMVAGRYEAGQEFGRDYSWVTDSVSKLWLPSDVEVNGWPAWTRGASDGYGISQYVQYPIFKSSRDSWFKRAGESGGYVSWLTCSPRRDWAQQWLNFIPTQGIAVTLANTPHYAPVCFTIA